MRTINRSVAIVRPKQPYIDWANSFDDGGPTLNPEEARKKGTAYLIPEFDLVDQQIKYIERNYAVIFENELWGWMSNPEIWPKKRTLRMFKEWFNVEICEMVYDFGKGGIIVEED